MISAAGARGNLQLLGSHVCPGGRQQLFAPTIPGDADARQTQALILTTQSHDHHSDLSNNDLEALLHPDLTLAITGVEWKEQEEQADL